MTIATTDLSADQIANWSYVLEIVGIRGEIVEASDIPSGRSYLMNADVDAHDGLGECEWTDHLWEAKRFPTFDAAIAFWQQQSNVRPLREDGRPNRPLTSLTMCVIATP